VSWTLAPRQVFRGETAEHYNYFRDYDPATGRYIESDPIGLKGGLNTYGYVRGNPLRLTDPMGLEPPRRATCYWWDRPDSPYDYVFGGGRRYGPPLVTMPWPGPGDPMPDYMPDAYGEKQPTCFYWWRPPRRCELACFATALFMCTGTTAGTGGIGMAAGAACKKAAAERCEKSCGDPPPCMTGNDFSHGAP
jgi:RHS repeat-associated protein